MVKSSVTIRHSLPTNSYPVIFLLPLRTFPIGFFSCCSLVGHSCFAVIGGVEGTGTGFIPDVLGASGGFTFGTFASPVNTIWSGS